jgi:2-methylcitrate dehydratase
MRLNTEPMVWDATVKRLVAFTERARYEDLSAKTIHETKLHLIDTFASALGAFDEPVSVMSRTMAKRYRSDDLARVWGCDLVTTPEMAAFANGVMTRSLDVSDTYLGRSRGHPSDMIPGLVAVAESTHADGKSLINAIVLAYDVYCSFCKHVDINSGGWDQPVYTVMGCVLGAAKLMRLSPDQTGHALSLALTPNLALSQARRGSLSSWKGCAGANAARNAVFAAVLSKQGFTGPGEIFEGSGGFWDAVGRADWPLPEAPMIGETRTKFLPVCYHGQSAVFAAMELRDKIDLRQIEEIRVDAYQVAVFMMGNDASRWAPATRETADHSLPYCVAIALLDGKLVRDSFADERLRDSAVADLMRKVKVAEDPALTAQYPEGAPGRVTIRLRSGETHVAEIRYPRGHEKSPMSDAEVENKFRNLSGGLLGAPGCDRALKTLWQLENIKDAGAITALLVPHKP